MPKVDIGKDVDKRGKSGLANAVQKAFMNGYLVDHQDVFVECMNEIREGAPVKYAELYIKMYGMNQAKETNINMTVNMQKDVQDLFALAKTKSQPKLGKPSEEEFVPFEELGPTGIPIGFTIPSEEEKENEIGMLP